jgi:hypothetical protein
MAPDIAATIADDDVVPAKIAVADYDQVQEAERAAHRRPGRL